jgi:hypothetical protein
VVDTVEIVQVAAGVMVVMVETDVLAVETVTDALVVDVTAVMVDKEAEVNLLLSLYLDTRTLFLVSN